MLRVHTERADLLRQCRSMAGTPGVIQVRRLEHWEALTSPSSKPVRSVFEVLFVYGKQHLEGISALPRFAG